MDRDINRDILIAFKSNFDRLTDAKLETVAVAVGNTIHI
ncbi:MAG: hypothetical protein K0R50_4035 [Eubacterium sp.]|jgi:hypothetical protein|nr:hypothetical protein [Eubacterium sp.]